MPASPICVFGEVLFDRFPDGHEVLGGAPFNVAWHLAAFGEHPLLVSAVGADAEGERVRAAMRDWGMDERALQTDPEHPTGAVAVSLTGGEPSYDILADVAYDHVRPVADDLGCALLYHGTLALRGAESARTLESLRADSAGQVYLDVNLRSPWWTRAQVLALVDAADWVKLNRDELALLSSPAEVPAAGYAQQAAAFRTAHGLAGVILTLGADGALACTADESPVQVEPPPRTQMVDAVGAGDAFAAVSILGIRRGWPLAVLLERAQAFAARIVGQRGAIAADRGLYAPFIADWA
jgi:fructokinase